MWNEQYVYEYIKMLEDKLFSIKSLIDLFNGIDNEWMIEQIINELNGNRNKEKEIKLMKEKLKQYGKKRIDK